MCRTWSSSKCSMSNPKGDELSRFLPLPPGEGWGEGEFQTMRSAILILLTVLLVAGGLALYTLTQPPPAPKPLRTLTGPSTARATTGESIRGIGSGENAWVKRYEGGELHSQFRGDKYE